MSRIDNTILLMLLTISISSALTINVDSAQSIIEDSANLTINYELRLDEALPTNYSIWLYNDYNEYLILNKSEVISELEASVEYNTSKIASGDYTLELRVNNPSITVNKKKSEPVTITQQLNYQAIIPETIYVTGEEGITDLIIINNGNSDLSISAYFLNTESDISLNPQSFKLEQGMNKTITATIQKPTNEYTTTLVINSINEDLKKEYNILVTKPIINITLTNLEVLESSNETIIESTISNNGNKDVNATLNVRTFKLTEGFETITREVSLKQNDTINHSLVLPKTSIVKYELTYNNGTSNLVISREFSILSSIPTDINLSSDKLILIGVIIILLVLVLYNKLFGRRRP